VSILGDLAGHVVANDGVEAGDKHESVNMLAGCFRTGHEEYLRFVQQLSDPLLISLQTIHEMLDEAIHRITQYSDAVQQIPDHEWLEYVQLELSTEPTNGGSDVVTHDLGGDHGHGLTLCRVDLSRHDGGARLVLRQDQFTETASWTGPEIPDILCDLEEGACQGVHGSAGFDDGVMCSQNFELVGRSDEFCARHLGDFLCNALGEPLECVEARADCSATLC